MTTERLAYTVAEVARMLGVPQSTVRTWAGDGTITTLRIGRRVLIPASTLSALVERNTARGRLA